jgi:NAD(P)-dependent dehydrogenase (short-subunit alcohol dehydrogenase family)
VSEVILVTGGASGLGAALCRELAKRDATVLVADLQQAAAQRIADEIGGHAYAIDLSDGGACALMIEDIVTQHGGLDVLINNAGTDKTESVEDLDVADFRRVVDVNLNAPFALAKAAFPVMRAAGKGYIVNIVSTAAKRAWANASAYHASKWGLLGLSHALHVEGRAHGIKVTALLAGGMRTPFILDRFPDTPLENLQTPEAVAQTVAFLLDQPGTSVIPELMIVPMTETSWP